MAQPDNPHDLCTWRDGEQCRACGIQGLLKCRHSYADLLAFGLMSFTGLLSAGIGMYRAGYGWWILVWAAFALFFFNVWESKILCSHCPFYARTGKTLACLANHGCIKIWKYNPAPMSRWEQTQFFIGAFILVAMPLPFLILGKQWLFLGLTALGLAAWTVNTQRNVCSACVNFSCPGNRVPKPVVDAYLSRNPIMREAWLAAGYRLDSGTSGRISPTNRI